MNEMAHPATKMNLICSELGEIAMISCFFFVSSTVSSSDFCTTPTTFAWPTLLKILFSITINTALRDMFFPFFTFFYKKMDEKTEFVLLYILRKTIKKYRETINNA